MQCKAHAPAMLRVRMPWGWPSPAAAMPQYRIHALQGRYLFMCLQHIYICIETCISIVSFRSCLIRPSLPPSATSMLQENPSRPILAGSFTHASTKGGFLVPWMILSFSCCQPLGALGVL